MFENVLGFGCMHETKIFLFFVCFFKEKINLKFMNLFWILNLFFWNFLEKTKYFNTGSVSYNVNIQPNIMQNYWKNMRENHKYFEITLGNFFYFF